MSSFNRPPLPGSGSSSPRASRPPALQQGSTLNAGVSRPANAYRSSGVLSGGSSGSSRSSTFTTSSFSASSNNLLGVVSPPTSEVLSPPSPQQKQKLLTLRQQLHSTLQHTEPTSQHWPNFTPQQQSPRDSPAQSKRRLQSVFTYGHSNDSTPTQSGSNSPSNLINYRTIGQHQRRRPAAAVYDTPAVADSDDSSGKHTVHELPSLDTNAPIAHRLGHLAQRLLRQARHHSLLSAVLALICCCLLLSTLLPRFQTMRTQISATIWKKFNALHHPQKFSSFTIFSLLRDMTPETMEEIRVDFAIQWNSLRSWYELVIPQNIIVFVDTEESCTWLKTQFVGIQCMPVSCWHEEFHKPMLNCVFDDAHSHSSTDIMLMANGDIILTPAIGYALEHISSQYNEFAMVSQRLDLVLPMRFIDNYMDPANLHSLIDYAEIGANLHGDYGIDIFAYHKTLVSEMNFPQFLAGVYRWDNWLLSEMILRTDVTVVDATHSIQVIHQQLALDGSGEHGKRKGAEWNDRLVKERSGTHYKLGHMDNSELKLIGDCSNKGACQLLENEKISYDVLYTRKVGAIDNTITYVPVHSATLPLFHNWYCYSQKLNYSNYIVLAGDLQTANVMKAMGVATIVKPNAVDRLDTFNIDVHDVQSHYDLLLWQTSITFNTLQAGFHFMFADVSSLWLDVPTRHFDVNADLHVMMNTTDVNSPNLGIDSSLMFVGSTDYGRYGWKQVQQCLVREFEAVKAIKASQLTAATLKQHDLATCLTLVLKPLMSNRKMSIRWLDNTIFPDSYAFYTRYFSLLNGRVPSVVSTSGNEMTISDIQHKLQQWNLWAAAPFTDASTITCRSSADHSGFAAPTPPPAAAYDMAIQQMNARRAGKTTKPSQQPFRLLIRIFTQTRVEPLKRLLNSLRDALYDGDELDIEVSVDYPALDADADEVSQRTTVLKWAQKHFTWPHGSYKVIDQPTNLGLVGQWTQAWFPPRFNPTQSHNRLSQPIPIIMMLEDDTSVMPEYYRWLKRAIIEYYLNPQQYDSRMYGFSLQSQHTILGESNVYKYGASTTAGFLNPSDYLFKYQLLGTWGAVFFSEHWNVFLDWAKTNQLQYATGTSPIMQPCVPTSLSNQWWAANPRKTWTQWFIRFAYETGWYSLYTNYPAKASWVVNWREGGLNFADTLGPMNPGVEVVELAVHMQFPPSSEIPVHDFHFNKINSTDVLALRKYLAPPLKASADVFDICYTYAQYKKVVADHDKRFGPLVSPPATAPPKKPAVQPKAMQNVRQALPL